MAVVLGIDAGTTGVRTFAIGEDGVPRRSTYREFPQHFPRPGWVEHDAEEIWAATLTTLGETARATEAAGESVAAIGITNQRETTVVWSRATGRPLHRAIVWQDRRTAPRCDELREQGLEPLVRERTGLVLDPYFSGTKLAWLLTEGGVPTTPDLAFGTIDTWLLWKLTGGREHATEPSNASRTLCFDIGPLQWSEELCGLLGIPMGALPEVRPSSGRFGITDPDAAAGLSVPVSGIAGDQQAALFGQACFEPGMAKNTYGTGSFVLVNLGSTLPAPAPGLLTSVAWQIGDSLTYAMEGSIFVTGAAIQWLRDELGIIRQASEVGPLAESVPDAGGVVFVPAFTGLGSPEWDPYARGTILGLTRGSGRAQLARAAVEAMAYQTYDVVDAVRAATGTPLAELRVDGGASAMDLLCQLQADLLDVPVRRPAVAETTVVGAAYLAGIAEGVWSSPAEAAASWREAAAFTPAMERAEVDARVTQWRRAVERARGWAD
ncbi:MAG: glycerol kinase GlpK [Actinobacteria bacterium]|nr:glycerol kinase GlpK [Actinomycetota bacterium]